LARVELDSADTTAQWLVSRYRRYFFVLLALLGILIASIAFVPVFLKFAAGTFPIAWVLNIHGALMGTWLALFFAQAILASTGQSNGPQSSFKASGMRIAARRIAARG
jgi:hypothetical protein